MLLVLFNNAFPSLDLSFLICTMLVVGKKGLGYLIRGSHQLGQCQVPAGGKWLISHKTNQEQLRKTGVSHLPPLHKHTHPTLGWEAAEPRLLLANKKCKKMGSPLQRKINQ